MFGINKKKTMNLWQKDDEQRETVSEFKNTLSEAVLTKTEIIHEFNGCFLQLMKVSLKLSFWHSVKVRGCISFNIVHVLKFYPSD